MTPELKKLDSTWNYAVRCNLINAKLIVASYGCESDFSQTGAEKFVSVNNIRTAQRFTAKVNTA